MRKLIIVVIIISFVLGIAGWAWHTHQKPKVRACVHTHVESVYHDAWTQYNLVDGKAVETHYPAHYENQPVCDRYQ